MGKNKTDCSQSTHDYSSDGVISKSELKNLVPSVVKLVGHDDVNAVSI